MPKASKIPPAFYSAAQATRRLGLNRGTFFNYVKTGRIKKHTPPGASEGYYSRAEIDAMAQERELFFLQYSKSPQTFERAATEEDIRGIYDLSVAFYGVGNTPSLETRLAIWRKNPDVYYITKQENYVTGYISLIWFTDQALQFLMGPTVEQEASPAGSGVYSVTGPENVKPFVPGQPIDSLFVSLAVRPGLTTDQHRKYGFKLLRDTLDVLKDFADRGMPVRKLLATSEKTDGIKLARDMGMQEIKYPGDKLLRFELDMMAGQSPLALEYQAYVKQVQARWKTQFPALLEKWLPSAEPEKPIEGVVFRQAKLENINDEGYLAYLCFGPRASASLPARKAFFQHNPSMFYHLYDQGNLASAINLVPITGDALEEFKQGKRGWLFPLDKIEQFTPGPHHLIIIDFMTAPVASAERRALYGRQLLLGVAEQFRTWGSQGIEILSIHACGATDAGRRILGKAGFVRLGEPVPGRVIFELDVEHSDWKLLEPYKQALAAWKETSNQR